jgi:zinc transporter ZupT
VAFAAGGTELGIPTALAIGIQNVPESFAAAEVLLPVSLGFAAGAMVYVVVDEIVPESHLRGNERVATLALVVGFALMMVLDNALG